MKIQEIEFSRLIPADYNPRVALTPDMPEFERLKNNKIVLEGGTAREAAALIGERAAAMTQAYIMKGIDPPKSSITMETTKSGKPLYSTGRLYQSITYEIEEG